MAVEPGFRMRPWDDALMGWFGQEESSENARTQAPQADPRGQREWVGQVGCAREAARGRSVQSAIPPQGDLALAFRSSARLPTAFVACRRVCHGRT
eukprot:scaffold2201_cov110-Isochrysis_galbana.AAC.12